jgi:hypothetical protein
MSRTGRAEAVGWQTVRQTVSVRPYGSSQLDNADSRGS